EIGIGRDLGPASFSTLSRCRMALLEPRRPDDVAADAYRAVDARQRCALLRGKGSRGRKARPLDPARALYKAAIDHVTGHRAGCGTDRAADRPQHAAEKGPGSLKQYRCHEAPIAKGAEGRRTSRRSAVAIAGSAAMQA